METATAARPRKGDGTVLGLVVTGHFLSHFYMLLLPPLFVLLKEEWAVSYAALGLLITVFNGVAGTTQIPVGFLVDRVGARVILVGGLVLLSGAMGLIGLSHSYWVTLALVVVAGAGHSVFHPANYAILSIAVDPRFMGRAFSIHTFSGHIGGAAAPATVGLLTAVWGWRVGLMASGGLGLLVALAMALNWSALHDPVIARRQERAAEGEGAQGGTATDWSLLLSRPMVLFFLFFMAGSLTSGGIHNFSIAALVALRDIPVAAASTALTCYLFASSAGILLGGVLADRTTRHNLIAAGAFLLTGVMFVLMGKLGLPVLVIYLAMTAAGLCQGLVRPARDMMVRAASPRESTGKVFGFVSTGISMGAAISPAIYGWVVDQGASQWVFYLAAIITVGGMLTVLAQRQQPAAA